ncbi:hypothetical protein [Pseudomonas sp. EA_15y_Pfl1_P104]|uniref:hypothetical protein n=1 Tax=Pseudomonas sp. EA_15y_Pfl1_P104 TaxID=3088686 RepID=UPI0030D95D25
MSKFIPLSGTTSDTPVLLINADATLVDILGCADRRIRAIGKLMTTLSCMTACTSDESDLFQIADMASLLLDDGCSLLSVAQRKAMTDAQMMSEPLES